jgi:hypothetical protein
MSTQTQAQGNKREPLFLPLNLPVLCKLIIITVAIFGCGFVVGCAMAVKLAAISEIGAVR